MSKNFSNISTTNWTVIVLAQQGDPVLRARGLEILAEKYREPIQRFIEAAFGAHRLEQSEDLVQGYFVKFLQREFLDRLDQSKGRLRGFLMTTVRRYVLDEMDKGRVGATYSAFNKHHALPAGENIPDQASLPQDQVFMRAWARQLMNEAIAAFRLSCLDHWKKDYYDVFERHVLDHNAYGNPSYEDTAKELGMTVKRVENCRANAQKNFICILRDMVRATVATDDEVDQELAELEKYLR